MTSKTGEGPARSLHQIVGEDGAAGVAAHTDPLWVSPADKSEFAHPRKGNTAKYFVTGEKYFADLIAACDAATSEICIAGWQVNWDATLAQGLKLYWLLYRCAKRGVTIYVMPWDDTEPVQTYDDQTKVALESMNARLAKEGAKGRVHVGLSKGLASINNSYFSHHQKQVVVDRKIAYVGGIDVAYGRFEDETFDLHADAKGREMMNRYNPGLPMLQKVVNNDAIVDPDLMVGPNDTTDTVDPETGIVIATASSKEQADHIAKGGWQVPYEKAGMVGTAMNMNATSANTAVLARLDATRQPRMPWNDVHCRIEGPAVADLLRNFVLRWNTLGTGFALKPAPLPATFKADGKVEIQVLRSAPGAHCDAEKNGGGKPKKGSPGARTQTDIQTAMVTLIEKARRYIYIENQFFVSDYGQIGGPRGKLSPAGQFIKDGAGGIPDWKLNIVRRLDKTPSGNPDELPQNLILPALLKRFKKAILDDATQSKFHLYMTLPVHPEGALNDAAIAVQVYNTMQTIAFGTQSLLTGLRRLLMARIVKDRGLPYDYLFLDSNKDYENIPVEACFEYVTLLNLRNWAKLGNNYVTEQIYVHSKLMIVDDRFVIMGSANVNDRSLLGERDSELAVLIQDGETLRKDINGKGSNQPVRKFAYDLRVEIWKKLFGITGAVRPASHLATAIEQPGHPESWKLIQEQAKANAALYDAAFPFIPKNSMTFRGRETKASIIPTWVNDPGSAGGGYFSSPMPFEDEFWTAPRHTAAASELEKVKGFITALPIEWTTEENVRILYPSGIIVHNKYQGPEDKDGFEPQQRVASTSTPESQGQVG